MCGVGGGGGCTPLPPLESMADRLCRVQLQASQWDVCPAHPASITLPVYHPQVPSYVLSAWPLVGLTLTHHARQPAVADLLLGFTPTPHLCWGKTLAGTTLFPLNTRSVFLLVPPVLSVSQRFICWANQRGYQGSSLLLLRGDSLFEKPQL